MMKVPAPISGPLYKGLVGALSVFAAGGTVAKLRAQTPRRIGSSSPVARPPGPARDTPPPPPLAVVTRPADEVDAIVSQRPGIPPGIDAVEPVRSGGGRSGSPNRRNAV